MLKNQSAFHTGGSGSHGVWVIFFPLPGHPFRMPLGSENGLRFMADCLNDTIVTFLADHQSRSQSVQCLVMSTVDGHHAGSVQLGNPVVPGGHGWYQCEGRSGEITEDGQYYQRDQRNPS